VGPDDEMTRAAGVMVCAGCGIVSDDEAIGWVSEYADTDDDAAPQQVFFCPECAELDLA
jgi:hypothetical protein